MKLSVNLTCLVVLSLIIVSGNIVSAEGGRAVLFEQAVVPGDTNYILSQDFVGVPFDDSDIFSADDFTIADPGWDIGIIHVDGSGTGDILGNATELHWAIFSDGGGVPDGDPIGAGNPPVWSLSLTPTDPQVAISAGPTYQTDITLTLATPLSLPAGTYWLTCWATSPIAAQFGFQMSDTGGGATAQVIQMPGGVLGFPETWSPITGTPPGATYPDLAFRIEGVAVPVELQSFSVE
ncbi:MAG: hypothetical protein ABFS37_08355 [Acidobacteriota bacterium]